MAGEILPFGKLEPLHTEGEERGGFCDRRGFTILSRGCSLKRSKCERLREKKKGVKKFHSNVYPHTGRVFYEKPRSRCSYLVSCEIMFALLIARSTPNLVEPPSCHATEQ